MELKIMQKNSIWNEKKPKIKRLAFSNNCKDGGLKGVEIFAKASSLQCSWIKRLFHEYLHEWKIILVYLTKTNFCRNFKFHPRLEPSVRSIKNVPIFYKVVIKNWAIYIFLFPLLTISYSFPAFMVKLEY